MVIRKVLFLLLALPLISGCSVIMAANSEGEPDLSVLRSGTPEAKVEEQLGKPISSIRHRTNKVNTYQYFTNDDPSFGRAATYVVLDIITVGVAEVITTPVEALQGDKHVIEVTFDLYNRVESVKKSFSEAPLPKPEKVLGLEKQPSAEPPITPVAVDEKSIPPKARLKVPKPDEI